MKANSNVKIISVTFKIDDNIITTSDAETPGSDTADSLKDIEVQRGESNFSDFQCINGQMHIKICVGDICKWAPIGKSC